MLQQILGVDIGTVVFAPDAAGVGTVTISAMTAFSPARILAITNLTRGVLIYVPEGNNQTLAGAWTGVTAAGGVLTLQMDTTTHNAADILRVVYANANAVVATSTDVLLTLSITRPTNVTPYSANDVIGATGGAVLTFTSTARAGGSIYINNAQLEQYLTALPAGQTSYRLHLYSVTPASALADNAPFTLTGTDRDNYLGYIDLGTPALVGGTPVTPLAPVGLTVKLAAGSTTLYGYLVTAGGFTPAANSEVYKIWLNGYSG